MQFNTYQTAAHEFAVYKSPLYPALALCEETGELVGKLAKSLRKVGTYDAVQKDDVTKELGDVLWNLSEIAWQFGIELDDVAVINLLKLRDRKARNKIEGEGDDR